MFKNLIIFILFTVSLVFSVKKNIEITSNKNTSYADYDINYYLHAAGRTTVYFSKFANETDVNTAISVYHTKAIFKLTLKDYADVLNMYQVRYLKELIKLSDYILSHYMYNLKPYTWDDIEFRVSRLFQFDEPFIFSMETFNRNKLKKWLLTPSKLNEFLEYMDDATLPKEIYVKCVNNMDDYYPSQTSDICLSHISFNDEPVHLNKLSRCKNDNMCYKQVERIPSVAYALSHRLLYLTLSKYVRRCTVFTEKKDTDLIDMMCAQMYREAVYVARRGFFARDMFLEHIALCATMGYEEFFRRPWLLKAASWVDAMGCVSEFRNFDVNRTRVIMDKASTPRQKEIALHKRHFYLTNKCRDHTMAVGIVVLSQAVRHSAYLMRKQFSQSHLIY